MKIKLLNDGGYAGLDSLEFPIIVNAYKHYPDAAKVSGNELINAGGDADKLKVDFLYFFFPAEFEALE